MNDQWKPKCFGVQYEDTEYYGDACRMCEFAEDCEIFTTIRWEKSLDYAEV